MDFDNDIYRLYQELLKKHGNPKEYWPQWCANRKTEKLREIIAIGAILVQRSSWNNADISLRNLKSRGLLSLSAISRLKSSDELVNLIRPSGFYQTKPKRLTGFAGFVVKQSGGINKLLAEDLSITREKLLSLYGIGEETADVILLYALDKPSFVIDEYTRRLVKTLKLTNDLSYSHLKSLFENSLPKDVKIYQNYHALIIIEQRGKNASIMRKV